ncbi:MAG: AGE family epimerase/isomerase [Rubrivivax sp.]|nr:AGE family epimerase/isomerase [Rubrivivax sp.]
MTSLARRRLMLLALTSTTSCDISGSRARIDGEWHRRALLEGHLSKWLAVAPTSSGWFATSFDRRWRPKKMIGTSLTQQSRLVYAMASGFELTQDRRYLEAATRGADFLLDRFHDAEHGGFYNSVSADGKVVSDSKQSYGHAFALFALSHMFRVGKEERFRTAAMRAWRDVDANLRDASGGLRGAAARDFTFKEGARSQNPVMHMFEALLALVDATGDAEARAGATSVGNFVVYKLLQGSADGSAFIPEWYDEQWRALPTREKGGYVDLGHQFEWSHMLLTSNLRGLPEIFAPVSERVLQYALKVGYDESEGGAFSTSFPDGSIARNKYWWPQAECLRALITAAAITDRADLWHRYEQTMQLVRNEFIDPENGGWRNGSLKLCARDGCPDEQPDPYHMTGMHLAAIRVAAESR